MMGLISEEGESSSSGMVSSTGWQGSDLDLPEALYSPDGRKFFEYIERLMADNREATWSPHHMEVIEMLDSRGTPEDFEKFYQVDEGAVSGTTGDETKLSDKGVPKERARRRRFFGIYERVKVKVIWTRMTKQGKKRRAGDYATNTINYASAIRH
ncbi:hypothetical protein R1sor_013739 [Riccia sorocarpa]|uniref:Uncharacterized protein n=1 Tax=Riccia sorocarpa TaxID=122646 RepID=A0ABD3HAM6_9MARC